MSWLLAKNFLIFCLIKLVVLCLGNIFELLLVLGFRSSFMIIEKAYSALICIDLIVSLALKNLSDFLQVSESWKF